ncbi:hypothetical protein [Streptomyces sp. NPDC001970]
MRRSQAPVGGNLVLILLGMAAWGMSLTVSPYAQQALGHSALLFGLSSAVIPARRPWGRWPARPSSPAPGRVPSPWPVWP